MTTVNRDSMMAVISEYLAKCMLYSVGYLMARSMGAAEFGRLTAALAFATVIMNFVDSGMGQIAAKQIAQSKSFDAENISQLFTWRSVVILVACAFALFAGHFFLPPAAYQTALWLTPFCLLIGVVDLAAWVLKGLQRIPAYCAALLGSRAILLALSIIALHVAPGVRSMLVAYGVAGAISCVAALCLLSVYTRPLHIASLKEPFLADFLQEVYKYAFILIASAIMVRIDLILVAKLCGEEQAGLYGCAAFVIDALNLVPMAVYGVCLPVFAAAHGQSASLVRLFRAPFLWLCVSSALLAVWAPLLALPFFNTFFGERFAMSSVYFGSLLWTCIPFYANTLLWAILLTRNAFKTLAASMAVGLTAQIALNLILLPQYGPSAAAWSRMIGMSLVFLICLHGVCKLRLIPWENLLVRPGLAVAAILLAAPQARSPWAGATVATGLAIAFLFLPSMPKLIKLWNWINYSLRLGRGLVGKATLLYMFFRWKVIAYGGEHLRKVLPFPNVIEVTFRGTELSIHAADDNSFLYLFYEIFIGEDYRLDLPRPPKCIIDAGAHYGLASLYFSCLYPSAVIHALEPCSINFHHLRLNTRGFKNVRTHNVALYSRTGTERLYLQSGSGEHSLLAGGSHFENIKTATLDDFMIAQQIERVDVLKIDVEGSEEAILTTSTRLDRVDHITGELHFEMCSLERIQKALAKWFDVDCVPGAPGCGVLRAVNRKVAS